MKDGKVRKSFQKAGKKKNTERTAATVIFVPITKGSLLLKSLKEDEERMSEITGFKIKYQEAGGSVLTNFFCKYLGKGMHCGRPVCPPCNGDSAVRGNCRARNVTYESVCTFYNPTSKQEDYQMNIQPPGKESSIVTIPREGVYNVSINA